MKLDVNRLAAAVALSLVLCMAVFIFIVLTLSILETPSILIFILGFCGIVAICYWSLKDKI